MNSCLYECETMHCRFEPVVYKLKKKMFMFYLDTAEITELAMRLRWLSHNHPNLYNYKEADHLDINAYLRLKQAGAAGGSRRVLTHLRTLGYLFNPVSFHFGFDASGAPSYLVPEVGNTFGELKCFYLGREKFDGAVYRDRQTKYYYISPFVDLDAELDFNVKIPGERLGIQVDDWKNGKKFFVSTLTGDRRELTDANLIRLSLRYPLVTLQVISLIHWHAFRLYLKHVPHHNKEEHPELQREVGRERK